ncbi:CARDB domain-containing protein [Haloarculaceae archaeon H-GB2-1]|nr:CARDB domain-containing protein [Haloarculaceae archaeon H-GB1-1]MEA5385801.1 CARDB domain-containing protein [Haloarculaceae archaeon H-GB11]MEA5407301.1 CARDB domain-containing protein [Haloarculaceae archaeon H-GB2-1]
MASVSASHLILFIASMLIAASVAGTFTDSVGRLSEALDEQGVLISEEVRTDVEIISDSGSDALYDDAESNLTLLVKNTGSGNLDAESRQIDVLVNGSYQTDVTVSLLGGSGVVWGQGDVVEVVVGVSLGAGDHRAKIIVNGDEEVLEFRT